VSRSTSKRDHRRGSDTQPFTEHGRWRRTFGKEDAMLDEVIAAIVPGGVWLVAGAVIGAAFAERLRPVAVRVVRASMDVADRAQEFGMEAVEKGQDLLAEARQQRIQSPPAAEPTRARSRSQSTRRSHSMKAAS
jgi:hypothetical protein